MPIKIKKLLHQLLAIGSSLLIIYFILLLFMDPNTNYESTKDTLLMVAILGLVVGYCVMKIKRYKRHRLHREERS